MKKLGKKGEAPLLIVRIPQEMMASVKKRVKDEGGSMSELVRLALEAYLERPVRKRGRE